MLAPLSTPYRRQRPGCGRIAVRQYLEVLAFPISELGKLEPCESILRIDLQDVRPKFAKLRQGYGSDIHRGALACKPRPSLEQMNGPDNDENYSPIRLA